MIRAEEERKRKEMERKEEMRKQQEMMQAQREEMERQRLLKRQQEEEERLKLEKMRREGGRQAKCPSGQTTCTAWAGEMSPQVLSTERSSASSRERRTRWNVTGPQRQVPLLPVVEESRGRTPHQEADRTRGCKRLTRREFRLRHLQESGRWRGARRSRRASSRARSATSRPA